MVELETLARPYAKAAFEYADNHESHDSQGRVQSIEQWSAGLQLLSAIVEHKTVNSWLQSPELTATDKAAKILDLVGDIDAKIKNFIVTIATNKRLLLIPEISRLFDRFKRRSEQQIDVFIQTAFDLSASDKTNLTKSLEGYFNSKITVQAATDASLIGGVVIHANGSVIDASMKSRLKKFTESTNS